MILNILKSMLNSKFGVNEMILAVFYIISVMVCDIVRLLWAFITGGLKKWRKVTNKINDEWNGFFDC